MLKAAILAFIIIIIITIDVGEAATRPWRASGGWWGGRVGGSEGHLGDGLQHHVDVLLRRHTRLVELQPVLHLFLQVLAVYGRRKVW